MDAGTIAIIGIVIALIVSIVFLIIFFICYCCLRIQDDTNIRKRILGRQTGGYAQDQVKTTMMQQDYVPAPVPVPVPVRRVVQEVMPAPAPPQQQPEVVVHEVVHRYEPPPQEIVMPSAPQQRMVRRSSWSAPASNDEWIMIKKKKKKGPKVRTVQVEDSSSDEEEVTTRYGYAGRQCMPCMSPRMAAYDLALPCGPCARPMGVGMGMGAASYMVGARPMMATPVYGMAAAATPAIMAPAMVSHVPVMGMTGVASSFQPTYGAMVPRM